MKRVSIALMVMLAGCGSQKASDATLSEINVTGWYEGTETVNQDGIGQYSATLKLILTQVGSSVTGTFETASGASGSVNGTLIGNNLSLILNYPYPCAGTVPLTANVLGNVISGSFSWPIIGACSAGRAVFSLTKQ